MIEPETRSSEPVHRREPPAEGLVEPRRALSPVDEFENEKARADRAGLGDGENLGHAQSARLAEPREPARFGREHPRGGVRVALHEHARAPLELRIESEVDVASCNGPHGDDRATELAGDRALEPVDRHGPSSRTRCSSSPRHDASQMSSTSSKPSGPP